MTPSELRHAIDTEMKNNDNFPSEVPIQETIGKYILMQPNGYALKHDAAPILTSFAEAGVPVDCGNPWKRDQIIHLLQRGPHVSAKQKDAITQLRTESNEKVASGYVVSPRTMSSKDAILIH